MSHIRIYHNPRCSKSRGACTLLAERGLEAEVVEYLHTPPGVGELRDLLNKLGMPAEALVRKGEDVFKTHYAGKTLSEEEWIAALAAHPVLIERPIVVCGEHAILARPPESLAAWLAALPEQS
ncbi:MAG TPA: arsenate reductase (glutaredoxin) [Rhodocyclaceae bacterium]|nr:arsenate reductase (glutaredoxin) [Rhodocyclaceae bacterium]